MTKEIRLLLLLGVCVLVGVGLFTFSKVDVAVYGRHTVSSHDNAVDQSEAVSSSILGTWELNALSSDGGATTTEQYSDYPDYWGFAVLATSTNEFRNYDGSDASGTLMLSRLETWRIAEDDSGLYLETYFWNSSKDDYSIDSDYQIISISSTTLVVREVPTMYTQTPDIGSATGSPVIFTRVRSAQEEYDQSLVLNAKERAIVCPQIMSGDFTDIYVPLPITCDAAVSTGGELLHFTFTQEGDIEVRRGNNLIFDLTSHEKDSSMVPDILLRLGERGPFLDTISNPITLADVTYDGYKDLAVKTSTGVYNFTYNYFAYDPAQGTFIKKSLFVNPADSTSNTASSSYVFGGITNPAIDLHNRTITSSSLGRGLGDIFYNETYHFQNGKYVLVKIENQDLTGGYDTATSTYLHTIRDFKNGSWATTTNEIIKSSSL